eukprot:gnl/TRDRNA2_/TRDRNA2_174964_c5_seq27.p1 gnl/TRDRNA2_/TRDRNA2_174964_c5~~gnl/TRDRNA2_/TRDRNA2_174964_c5_seq27.p1  ORF type:complete len:704 (+),score=277.55 gnl/TRDRNA2_/TRDRNA2_174964_c5_seq27:45-2156(+)
MMKLVIVLVLSTLCASPVVAEQATLSPVTRVVELLKSLQKKIEQEGKKEEDLYETYVCWATNVIDTKTASNTAAESRISELTTYIEDIEAGRVEFTGERATLEKELEGLHAELEAAKDLREKENKDFIEAEDEMNKAIKALEKAKEVLSEATKDGEEGEFVEVGEALNAGFAERRSQAKELFHAVELGEKFLTKGDALFMRKLLTGDVPDVDWKKLNRKAGFKMKYKARSVKIQDLIAKLLSTFKGNLNDATDKEMAAEEEYEKLKEAKEAQKAKAEEALASSEEEAGGRGMAKEDAQAEVDALTTQVENDKKFIEETDKGLKEKKEEWKVRSKLRSGEIEAISKAIATLTSDDARDLFKKSYSSQGLFFVQVDQEAQATRVIHATDVIRSAGKSARDIRLSALAAAVSTRSAGHFDEVIEAIDKMIKTLNEEEEKDKEIKETCEKDRMGDARDAAKTSRTIDEHSDTITKLEAEIEVIKQEIAAMQAEIKAIGEELSKAEKIRKDEHAEWEENDAADKAAAEIVGMAKGVLEDFYKENMSLFQKKHKKMEPVAAGEAPPPPPTTWSEPYGGAKGESQGVVAILGMIKEDIEKDREKAKAEEDLAQEEFEKFETESGTQIKDLNEEIGTMEGTQGDKEESVKDHKEERKTGKEELDSVMQKMTDALPGCDFMTINYPMRMENRQTEIDGLDKAKGILKGAKFD